MFGFFFAGLSVIGTFVTLNITVSTVEIADAFEKHAGIMNAIRPWWLKEAWRKQTALFLLDKGILIFGVIGVLSFLMQIPLKLSSHN
jgi:hypothetical protein